MSSVDFMWHREAAETTGLNCTDFFFLIFPSAPAGEFLAQRFDQDCPGLLQRNLENKNSNYCPANT